MQPRRCNPVRMGNSRSPLMEACETDWPATSSRTEEKSMEQKLSKIELAERKVAELQAALDDIQLMLHTVQEAQEAARRMMPLLMMVGGGLAAAGAFWYLLRRRAGN